MSAEIWSLAFELHPEPMFLIDCHSNTIYGVNQSILEQLGYTRDRLLSLPLQELIPLEYNQDLISTLQKDPDLLAMVSQLSLNLADGQIVPYQVRFRIIKQDQHPFALVILKDPATAAKERLLVQLTEQMPGIMYQLEILPDGSAHMSYVSDAVRQIMGIEPQELVRDPRALYRFILPQDLERIKEQHDRALLIGIGWQVEYRICHPITQQIRWIYGQAVPKQQDNKTIWHGYVADITEHIHLHDSLQASNERLHMAQNMAGIGVWELDLASGLMNWDQQMYQIHEQQATMTQSVSLETWKQWIYIEDQSILSTLNVETLTRENPYHARFRILGRNGMLKHIEMQCSLLYNRKNQPYKIIGINRDITRTIHTAEYLQHAKMEQENINFQLRERIKELTLMHQMARLLQAKSTLNLSVLQELIDLFPPGWLYPDICAARICWHDYSAMTSNWQDTAWKLSAFFTAGGHQGQIEVTYLEEKPERDEGPFLHEERTLLNSSAEMLQIYLQQQYSLKEIE